MLTWFIPQDKLLWIRESIMSLIFENPAVGGIWICGNTRHFYELEGWAISNVSVDENKQEIYVDLVYTSRLVTVDSREYYVFDFRESRSWRHLDLWQYKTFLRARMPRYKIGSEVKTISVPWADAIERMTYLLEKKR